MKREAAAALITFVITAASVPMIRHLCQRMRILDRPGALKIHARPVPRLGGVAIFLGIFAGLAASGPRNFVVHWQLFAAMFVIWTAGFVDDLRGLPPFQRIIAQVVSAVLLWEDGWSVSQSGAGVEQIVLLCLFVVLFANSFNFLDGSDGLATGVSCVIAFAYLALPRTALTPLGFSTALCMAAACAAFLPFNRHPASVFLGDSGATLLGFLAAFIGTDIASARSAPSHSIFLAISIAALPILDALRVVIKRIARRASPFSGDRNHFYDALLIKGWTPYSVAVASWMMVALCGAIAVCIVRLRAPIAWCALAFIIVAIGINFAAASREEAFAADSKAAVTRSESAVIASGTEGKGACVREGKEF